MKQIAGLLIITFSIISCNEDNNLNLDKSNNTTLNNLENISSKSLPIENDIDKMFYEYVNSIEYLNSENATKSFFQKLNINKSNFGNFTANNDIGKWLELNISTTSFRDLNSAKLEFDNLVNLKRIELEKFNKIETFILNEDLDVVEYYFDKWVSIENNKTSNYEECVKEFDGCNEAADLAYMHGVSEAYSNGANSSTKQTEMAQARVKYMAFLGYCSSVFDDCVGL